MKSIPVVQQVYQAILADMTSNFNVLLKALQQKPITITAPPTPSDLNEDNAEAALLFDCSALCQIGNVKGNLIGVSCPPCKRLSIVQRCVDVRALTAAVRVAGQTPAVDQLEACSTISCRSLWCAENTLLALRSVSNDEERIRIRWDLRL